MSTPMISTLPCQVVINCARAHGVEPARLCRSARVEAESLADPDGRVSITSYYALLEQLAEFVGRPHIGLDIPAHAQPDDYGLLGFLFMRSPSVGEALERMVRYHRLVADPVMKMELREGRAAITYELWGPPRRAHELVGDAFVAETVVGFEMLCGHELELGLELDLPRPVSSPAPYLDAVGIAPRFGAPELRLSFDARVLELPVRAADPPLSEMLDRQAERMLRSLPPRPAAPTSTRERVRGVVLELLPDGVPRVERVAKCLAESPRSLQRHLHDEETSLKAIIEELRRELAESQLRRGVATAELALLLGFSDASTFHRAFKRWTGSTPGQWRREHADGRQP